MSNQENGTIEVVLQERDHRGRIVVGGKKESFKTFGGIGGGGEWLCRQVVRSLSMGKLKHLRGDIEDKFFQEGEYAPSPE